MKDAKINLNFDFINEMKYNEEDWFWQFWKRI